MGTEVKTNRIIKINEENVTLHDFYNICDLIRSTASRTPGDAPKFNINIEITQIK